MKYNTWQIFTGKSTLYNEYRAVYVAFWNLSYDSCRESLPSI